MSLLLQYQERMEPSEHQIWSNAAFENVETEESVITNASFSNLQSVNMNQSIESDSSKENWSPVSLNSIVPPKSPVSVKTVHPQIHVRKPSERDLEEKRSQTNIDVDIEEIEKEISRLSSKLKALRSEKEEATARTIPLRRRIVPAKFNEQKQNFKNSVSTKKMDGSFCFNPKPNRRGVSLGPAEIYSASKSRQQDKQELITPARSTHSSRKSCFWKLQDIKEEMITKDKGRRSSFSPKTRQTETKIKFGNQAATTTGYKRSTKRENDILRTIHPVRKNFKDDEKSVIGKKSFKNSRSVSSRYNNKINNKINVNSSLNNMSYRRLDLVKSESDSCKIQNSRIRMKKRWEIPNEVVVMASSSIDEEFMPLLVSEIDLPKIKTHRYGIEESPRDSGPAKRVAHLTGKTTYFSADEVAENETDEE